MTNILMCRGTNCDLRKQCWRATATPSENQVWISFYKMDDCDAFVAAPKTKVCRRCQEHYETLLADVNPDMLLIDDCNTALIGYAERCGKPALACYDYAQLVQAFVDQGMTHEEAQEHISFNVAGAWMGEHTPLILYRRGGDCDE